MPFRFPQLNINKYLSLNFTKLQHKKDNIKYFQTFYSFIR